MLFGTIPRVHSSQGFLRVFVILFCYIISVPISYSKIVALSLELVVGMTSCILHWLIGMIFFRYFVVFITWPIIMSIILFLAIFSHQRLLVFHGSQNGSLDFASVHDSYEYSGQFQHCSIFDALVSSSDFEPSFQAFRDRFKHVNYNWLYRYFHILNLFLVLWQGPSTYLSFRFLWFFFFWFVNYH